MQGMQHTHNDDDGTRLREQRMVIREAWAAGLRGACAAPLRRDVGHTDQFDIAELCDGL